MTCTISGSFRQFWPEIQSAIEECVAAGVQVLSPKSGVRVGEDEGFVYLAGDAGSPREIEDGHLDAIRRSDFLYVVNPGGYIGTSATLEIGFAHAVGVPVFCTDAPREPILGMFSRWGNSVAEIGAAVDRLTRATVPSSGNLTRLQDYIRRVVLARGFESESVRDVLLLLMEEVGELARAIRRQIGLAISPSSRNDKTVGDELADCLIYLLDIANLTRVDLNSAFLEKERANWQKYGPAS